MSDSLKTDVNKAIGRVAAEYAYLKSLMEKLKQIESEDNRKGIKDTKKALHIFRWVGRAERKANQTELKIIKELTDLGEVVPDSLKNREKELLKELKIAEASLIEAASLFTGKVKKDLLAIETDEELLDKYGENLTVRRNLTELLKQSEDTIQNLIRWVNATEQILRKIQGFGSELERKVA